MGNGTREAYDDYDYFKYKLLTVYKKIHIYRRVI